jgi:hypothetical protein
VDGEHDGAQKLQLASPIRFSERHKKERNRLQEATLAIVRDIVIK